jgi:hypothetical protein
VQVTNNWVAANLELSKKTNRLRGTAGPRRALTIASIAKDKDKSVLKLSYMDLPIALDQVSKTSHTSADLAILTVISVLRRVGSNHCLSTALAEIGSY